MQTCLENTERPLLEGTPAWTIRVARPARQDRHELARELCSVPKAALRQVFGKSLGTRLWRENRAVAPDQQSAKIAPAPPVAAPPAVSDSEVSDGMLSYLCCEAAATLRERSRLAKSITLTLRYSNGESETAHQLLLHSTNDPKSLEAAAQSAIRGMRLDAFVSLKLDLTASSA
jgi:nucleotidyltransferase/DNA polymerase involved in DNA repair